MLRREFLVSLAALGLAPLTGARAAVAEGSDYIVLKNPIPGMEGTLVKVWSYACPFCYKFDAAVDPRVLPRIEKEAGLRFVPIHLESKGDYGRVASTILAALELKDEAAGRSLEDKDSLYKKAKDVWYFAYHKKGERWAEGQGAFVKTAAEATGFTPEELLAMASQKPAVELADKWRVYYDVAKLQGVPAYVVNGRYVVMTKAIRNFDSFVNMVVELSKKTGE